MSIQTTAKSQPKDYFVEREGLVYAGSHLIVDLWDADGLDDPELMEQVLVEAAQASRATILHTHFHEFEEGGGYSGVIVLAESHISVHTWPERGYAAIDIFMCGSAEPAKAIPVIRRGLRPERLVLSEHKRGLV